jgi:DNA-binding MarR family transcriptional regulator
VTGKSPRLPRHELTQADYVRLAEFRYRLRGFLEFSEGAALAAGLTAQQHQALLAIKGFVGPERITTGELARRLHIRHHSAVGLIDRLASKRLVTRRVGLDDRRQVEISLTAKAQTLLEGLSAAHQEELRVLAPLLRELLAEFERG